MHPLVAEFVVDLIYLAAVAVPVGIIVTASETPKADRRTLLVMVVGAAACIALAWPLAELMHLETSLGLAIISSTSTSIAAYLMSRQLRRDPRLNTPAAAASVVLFSFAGVAVVGLAWIAVGIRDIGTIVLVAALVGIGLGAVYSRRVSRRTTAES